MSLPRTTRSAGRRPHGGIDCGDRSTPPLRGRRAAGVLDIPLCTILAAGEGNWSCPSALENFMKKLNERVRPPWPDDMEEALTAQREALRRRIVLLPSGRWP